MALMGFGQVLLLEETGCEDEKAVPDHAPMKEYLWQVSKDY